MKAIRIFLFILIIIGIIALITQKIWVPKLVDKILSYGDVQTSIDINQENIILENGRQCYTYSHDATKNEPYATSEFVDITITGKNVTGIKKGTQKGPDMNNGYVGTLNGTLDKETINAIFSYTIEGSKNKEREYYKTNKVGIEKLRYPLIEKGGMLVPDTTKEFKTLSYGRVGCTASN